MHAAAPTVRGVGHGLSQQLVGEPVIASTANEQRSPLAPAAAVTVAVSTPGYILDRADRATGRHEWGGGIVQQEEQGDGKDPDPGGRDQPGVVLGHPREKNRHRRSHREGRAVVVVNCVNGGEQR